MLPPLRTLVNKKPTLTPGVYTKCSSIKKDMLLALRSAIGESMELTTRAFYIAAELEPSVAQFILTNMELPDHDDDLITLLNRYCVNNYNTPLTKALSNIKGMLDLEREELAALSDEDNFDLELTKDQIINDLQWDEDLRGPRMSETAGKTIFKYSMPVKEEFTLKLPKNAEIIRVADQDGMFWLWAVVDTNAPTETRNFRAFKTGGAIPDDISLAYIGFCAITIQQELGLYIFEVK